MNQEYIPTKLPLKKEIETKVVLKKIISANRALAELKGAVKSIPNQSILINALSETSFSSIERQVFQSGVMLIFILLGY